MAIPSPATAQELLLKALVKKAETDLFGVQPPKKVYGEVTADSFTNPCIITAPNISTFDICHLNDNCLYGFRNNVLQSYNLITHVFMKTYIGCDSKCNRIHVSSKYVVLYNTRFFSENHTVYYIWNRDTTELVRRVMVDVEYDDLLCVTNMYIIRYCSNMSQVIVTDYDGNIIWTFCYGAIINRIYCNDVFLSIACSDIGFIVVKLDTLDVTLIELNMYRDPLRLQVFSMLSPVDNTIIPIPMHYCDSNIVGSCDIGDDGFWGDTEDELNETILEYMDSMFFYKNKLYTWDKILKHTYIYEFDGNAWNFKKYVDLNNTPFGKLAYDMYFKNYKKFANYLVLECINSSVNGSSKRVNVQFSFETDDFKLHHVTESYNSNIQTFEHLGATIVPTFIPLANSLNVNPLTAAQSNMGYSMSGLKSQFSWRIISCMYWCLLKYNYPLELIQLIFEFLIPLFAKNHTYWSTVVDDYVRMFPIHYYLLK